MDPELDNFLSKNKALTARLQRLAELADKIPADLYKKIHDELLAALDELIDVAEQNQQRTARN